MPSLSLPLSPVDTAPSALKRSGASAGSRAVATAGMVDALSGLIGCIGTPGFGQEALVQLNRWLPVSWWSVFELYDSAPPRMPVSGSYEVRDGTQDSWQAYRDSLYRSDQTFADARAHTAGAQNTLVHWHAHDIPRLHRERIYSRHGLRERVSLLCRAPGDVLVAVNLYRHEHLRAFGDAELDALSGAGAMLLACVTRHLNWQTSSDTRAGALDGLTKRERDVCTRMLKGWTHEGIALDLGISAGTVKTYRDRAFDKLGIHHRNELFALSAGTLV